MTHKIYIVCIIVSIFERELKVYLLTRMHKLELQDLEVNCARCVF